MPSYSVIPDGEKVIFEQTKSNLWTQMNIEEKQIIGERYYSYLQEGETWIRQDEYPDKYNIYEFTITFDPSYWRLSSILSYGVSQAITTIWKKIRKYNPELDYVVEYHENGRPHIHGQIFSDNEISIDHQKQALGMLTKKFGRSQWYQTENLDKYHEVSKMKWSEYIRKDLDKYRDNNQHGFTINNLNAI
jgi:hypothetical protein